MRITQYAYFAIWSDHLPSDEIGRRLGLTADRVMLRGSRSQDPLRPARHSWQIRCEQPGLRIDEQLARVLARIAPARDAIRDLVQRGGGDAIAMFHVVRYFKDERGEEEELPVIGDLQKLSGQHQLLGWRLDNELLAFMHYVGAELDADEYG